MILGWPKFTILLPAPLLELHVISLHTSGEMTDNCAANVYKLGGSLVASTETCLLRRIDGDTLDTQEKIDMSGLVNIASARALIDPDTKDVFNIAGKDTKAWTI